MRRPRLRIRLSRNEIGGHEELGGMGRGEFRWTLKITKTSLKGGTEG